MTAPAGGPRFPPFGSAGGVTVREVRTGAEFDVFLDLTSSVSGEPPFSSESRAGFRADFERVLREAGRSDRFLAWGGAAPIGCAGLEIVGEVARLWRAGVRPDLRGRGTYGHLVRVRSQEAIGRGAALALRIARVGTSGPILKQHGFRAVGSVRLFCASRPTSAGSDPGPLRGRASD